MRIGGVVKAIGWLLLAWAIAYAGDRLARALTEHAAATRAAAYFPRSFEITRQMIHREVMRTDIARGIWMKALGARLDGRS